MTLYTGTVILLYFKAKMLQTRFFPAYAGRAYSASPDLLARFKGSYLAYKGGEGEKGLSRPAKNTVAATVICCYALLILSMNVN